MDLATPRNAPELLLCRYDFTDGDLGVSLTQMRMFLDEYADIPFRVLRFLVTEINYGGRVTDDKDRRLINNLVTGFVGPQVLDPAYKFSASGAALHLPIVAAVLQPLGSHGFTALLLPEASVLVLERTLHSLSLQLQLNPELADQYDIAVPSCCSVCITAK